MNSLICPISTEKIDSNVSRTTIFINCFFTVVFMITQQPFWLYIAALDYGIRAFGNARYSPVRSLASFIIGKTGLKPKMIDKAPKVFASRLGFLCMLAASVFINFAMPITAVSITAMATSLFLLDSAGNFCVGCMIYHHLVFPFYQNR